MRTIGTVLAAAGLIAASVGSGSVIAGTPAGEWSPAGGLSTERPGPNISIILSDGRVLIAGPSGSDLGGIGNVDLYDPARGWSLGPMLDGDPVGAVAAPLPEGGALLAGGTPWHGGFDGPGPDPVATALIFSPVTSSWSSAPSMSTPRQNATATAMLDGRVLVVGGYNRKVTQLPNPDNMPFCCIDIQIIPLASAELFDPRTRTWSTVGSLRRARFGHTAALLKSGRVLVVGGDTQPNASDHLASAELFDPATGQWSGAGDIGSARKGFTLTALDDGRALLAGGLAGDGLTVFRSTLIFDPASDAWSAGPDMLDARTNHSAALLNDGRVLVSGGLDYLGRLAASEVFDSTTSGWTASGGLNTPRSDHTAVSLRDGRVLVAGGLGAKGGLASSEIFDPNGLGSAPKARTVEGPGSWLVKPSGPVTTYSQSLTLLRDGRVLLVPQEGYGNFDAQIYDPKTDRWSILLSRQTNFSYMAGVVIGDDSLLLITLDSEGQKPGKAEVIDVASGLAKPVASPGPLSSARLDLLPDGRVWLTGGPAGDKRSFFYDPSADRWLPGPDVPVDLYVGSVTPISEGRLLVGGISKAMILDPKSNAWIEVATYATPWSNYSATRLPDGDVLFAGGTESVAQPGGGTLLVGSTRVMRWHQASGLLTKAAPLDTPRPFHSTAVLPDGRVLVAGGLTSDPSTDPVATAELYDPDKDSWSRARSLPEARAQGSAIVLRDGSVLLVGGYGFFNPAHALLYSPPVASKPAASAASNGLLISARDVLLIVVAAVLIGLVFRSVWRRRPGP